jgi:hypothetical protein
MFVHCCPNRDEKKLKLALKDLNTFSDKENDIIADRLVQALFIMDKRHILVPILAGMVLIVVFVVVQLFK